MRPFASAFVILCAFLAGCQEPSGKDYDRRLFNAGLLVYSTKPTPSYEPRQFDKLCRTHLYLETRMSDAPALREEHRKVEFRMFDLINEAALRRDKSIGPLLDRYADSLGCIPSLAVRHYRYVFGDASQLNWLIEADTKAGLGRDSLILTVYGYLDEWDKTIVRFKQHDQVADGAAGEVLHEAMAIRKQIYGDARFDAAWKGVQ